MEFRTKREAEEAAQEQDRKAVAWSMQMRWPGSTKNDERVAKHRAEAARIRALLPTLPE